MIIVRFDHSYNYSIRKKDYIAKNMHCQNMIDVVHPRCKHDNCTIQPVYNYSNKKKGLYCKEHALPI